MSAVRDALAAIEQEDEDFPALLVALSATRYTGALILHCVEGEPKIVEVPGRQVRLRRARRLTIARGQPML